MTEQQESGKVLAKQDLGRIIQYWSANHGLMYSSLMWSSNTRTFFLELDLGQSVGNNYTFADDRDVYAQTIHAVFRTSLRTMSQARACYDILSSATLISNPWPL